MYTPIRLYPQGHPEAGFEPSELVAKEDFTTDDHTELTSLHYANDDFSLMVGVWECAPCRAEFDAYPVDEMMTIIAGSVTLTSPDGTKNTYVAGDTFFVHQGTPFIWENTETVKKHYMISSSQS